MTNKPIYKLVDGKGRVLIPKALRDAAKMEYGDIVRLGLADGRVKELCIKERTGFLRSEQSCG